MSGIFYFFILGIYLLAFSCGIYITYRLVKNFHHRAVIRTWLIVFYAENFMLMFLPSGTFLPGLPSLFKYGGSKYLMSFTELTEFIPALLRGQRSEEFMLLVLPLVPAFLVFLYTRRRHATVPEPPINTLPPSEGDVH